MFNSSVLDVAVGLIFTFLAVSLAVSAIVEALASIMGWRSGSLLEGVKSLLNDPDFNGLALKIYNHALVNPRDPGTAKGQLDLKNTPSYIDSGQFADALLEITETAGGAPNQVKSAIGKITDKQLQALLNGIYDRTAGDVGRMRAAIAAWFDNGMDRVGGAYKRKTQLWSLVIAVAIAVVCNVSAIAVGEALWQQPMLARIIAPSENLKLPDAVSQIEQLKVPVGWTCERFDQLKSWSAVEMVVGWLITAVATLFGAPFWFDVLQQFVRLKGSGPSPQEKETKTGAAA